MRGRSFVLGLWMPLVDCSLDMEPLRCVAGSHEYGNVEGMSISEESRRFFDDCHRTRGAQSGRLPASHRIGGSRTGTTGLEPVASGLTSRRDNHLRHAPRLAGDQYRIRANRTSTFDSS